MPLETHRMLALCTTHLSRDTAFLLDCYETVRHDVLPVVYQKGEYGWFVAVPERPDLLPPQCPTDLEACLHLAISQRFSWIMFDRDVEPIEHLPTFTW